MKIIRFLYKKKVSWGILEKDKAIPVEGDPFKKIKLSKDRISCGKIRLLTPAIPSKIILAGLNYRDHASELNMPVPLEPVIFLKPPTTVIGYGENIIYPKTVKRLDYEGELALIIKKEARNISEREVDKYILGYTCLNDVTARDLQKKDAQWTRAKSFDTFCPLGPLIETEVSLKDIKIKTYLNKKLVQNSSTSNFIFSVGYLVAFISRIMTLFPGDVISTGTPPGVGPMQVNDKIEVEIEGIGNLINSVASGDF